MKKASREWIAAALVGSALSLSSAVCAEGGADNGRGAVFTKHRLPPRSVELQPDARSATDRPWELPKPGDPLYDSEKELEIRENIRGGGDGASIRVRVYDCGVFQGYATLSAKKSPEDPADGAATAPRAKTAQQFSAIVIPKVVFQNEPLPGCLEKLSRLAAEAGGQGFRTAFKGEGWPRITFSTENLTLGEILEQIGQLSKTSIRFSEGVCEVNRVAD